MIPLAGGVIGALTDGLATHAVGKAAKLIFIEDQDGPTAGSVERIDSPATV